MSAPTPDDEIRQDVAELLVRYATGIDRKDWERFRSCFVRDCQCDYGAIGVWEGVDAITSYMKRTHPEEIRSLHRITNVDVRSLAPDRVAARSYVDVIFVGNEKSGMQAAGHYDDEIVRSADGWRIARRTYTQVHMAPISGI